MEKFRDLSLLLTVISVVIAVHGIEQSAADDGIGWTGARTIEGRITYLGFLNDPNDLSMAFLMGLPLTLHFAWNARWFVLRYAAYAAAGVTLYGIYLCNSRGSVLGLVSMLGLYVARRFGIWRGMLLLPVVLGALLAFSPSRSGELTLDDESAAGRVDAWYEGFEMFRSRPLLGVGAGLFTDHHRMTAHNSFVLAIAELGAIGYFVWASNLMISGVMLRRLLKTPEPPPPPPPKAEPSTLARRIPAAADERDARRPTWAEIQGAAAALSYACIGALVAAFFLSRTYVVFLYLLIALVVAVHQMARRHWPAYPPVAIGPLLGRFFALSMASIAGLWLLTRVLLSFA
jgi:hypothetical protein